METLLEEAHYLAQQGHFEEAINRYTIVGREWAKDPEKAPLWLANLAGFEYSAGQPARALEHVRRFGKDYPESPHITKVIDLAYRLGQGFLNGRDSTWDVMFRSAKTIVAFEFIQKHDPYSLQAAEGQMAISYIKMEKGQWDEALVHLKDIMRKQPGSEISASTEVAIGECYLGLNKGAEYDSRLLELSERYLLGYLNNYPNGLEREKASTLLTRVYKRLGHSLIQTARYYCTARKWKASMNTLQNLLKDQRLSLHHVEAEKLVEYVTARF
jgi:outer membrane protein assembly factor BamD (BamD/ComL family)